MPFINFFTATFAGAYIWCTVLIGTGYVLGHEWAFTQRISQTIFPYLLGGGVLALALYFWVTRLSTYLWRITQFNSRMIRNSFSNPTHELFERFYS